MKQNKPAGPKRPTALRTSPTPTTASASRATPAATPAATPLRGASRPVAPSPAAARTAPARPPAAPAAPPAAAGRPVTPATRPAQSPPQAVKSRGSLPAASARVTGQSGARRTPDRSVKLTPASRPPAGLLKASSVNTDSYAVTFEFFNPNASEVSVCGTFNDWEPGTTPMKRGPEGRWTAQQLLPPGRYEYRLVVDGQWQEDPMSRGFITNQYGGLNSVVEVRPLG